MNRKDNGSHTEGPPHPGNTWSRDRARVRRWVAAGATGCMLAAAPAAPAAQTRPVLEQLTVSTTLLPGFAPSVHDYVVRCDGSTSVRVSARAQGGAEVFVDGVKRRRAAIRLEPGQAFTVEARVGGAAGSYSVRCLPPDFPAFTETRLGRTPYWYVVTPSLSLATARGNYVAIFDGNGVPVWWYRATKPPIDAKLLPGPLVAYATYPVDSHAAYDLRGLDGQLVRRVTAPAGLVDDHELQRRANGDLVFLVARPKQHVDLSALGGATDATVLEDEIDEIAPNGKLVWSWSTDGHISVSEAARWASTAVKPVPLPAGGTGYDVFHANAVSLHGSTVLLSLRQTDAVYAIDRASGSILWKLGGTPTPYSLTVVGDPDVEPLGGQHDARLLPDGTLTVFDDGTFLGRAPRAVHYRIDTASRTATLVDQITDPQATESVCCGSARRLGDGNWLISWGSGPLVGEYEPDGTPVFRLDFNDLFSYRAVAVARSRLSAVALRAGMDAMHPRR